MYKRRAEERYYKQMMENKIDTEREIIMSVIRQHEYNKTQISIFSSKMDKGDFMFFNFLWLYYLDSYLSTKYNEPLWRRAIYFLTFNWMLFNWSWESLIFIVYTVILIYIATMMLNIIVELGIHLYDFFYHIINRGDTEDT
jgi:hypothetical protein